MIFGKKHGLNERLLTFRHGVHPEEYKELSDHCAIERMPFVEMYTLPLSQHLGAPSRAIVRKGQEVRRGELIAEPASFVSVGLHSPVDGTVVSVGLVDQPNGQMAPGIRIKTDPYSPQRMAETSIPDPESISVGEFLKAVQGAGMVGRGGGVFPPKVKFSFPKEKTGKYLILNGG